MALTGPEVVGTAQTLSDGEIQAFLAVLLVDREHRGAAGASRLVHETLARTRSLRLDLISAADGFYHAAGFTAISGSASTAPPS